MRRVLFITWDGPQSRYLETLFVPIFRRLQEHGYQFHILQFTWGPRVRREEVRAACEASGIPYRSATAWRGLGGVAPFFSAAAGGRKLAAALRQWKIDIVMPRSIMPSLTVFATGVSNRLPIVFDADGLPADERVDFTGLSPNGPTYRLLRDVEAQMVRSADVVLTRTQDAVGILSARGGAGTPLSKFIVVSNGVEPDRFLEDHPVEPPQGGAPLRLCFCGSFGRKYRPKAMLDLAKRLKSRLPDLQFSIFTPDIEQARAALSDDELGEVEWIEAISLTSDQVPPNLQRCDLGLAMIEATFSTRTVVAIKIGEYLLSGLPVVCTPGVGGVDALPASDMVYAGDSEDTEALMVWLKRLSEKGRTQVRVECRRLGLAHFGLDATVSQYIAALSRV